MVPLEVAVATRTPIPLVLKPVTATFSISDILTATSLAGTATTPTGDMIAGTPQGYLTQTTETAGMGMKTPTSMIFPTRAPVVIIVGKPTISIVHVIYADSITVSITNLDPNTELKIRMGSPRSYGTDGPVVDTVKADATGTVESTYKIPEKFIGYGQIEFRIEFPDGRPYYFPFYNNNY